MVTRLLRNDDACDTIGIPAKEMPTIAISI
jgi:hypothetical protein